MTIPECLGASHNIVGYILPNGESGYADHGDFGMGRTVVRAMNDQQARGRAVFVTRVYGGQKLGLQRYSVIAKLTKTLCPKSGDLHDLVTYIGTGGKVIHSHHGPPHAMEKPRLSKDNANASSPAKSKVRSLSDMDTE